MLTKLYEQRLRKGLFRLSIITIATVVIWMGLGIYRSLTKIKIDSRTARQIKPLTPSIDLDTMDRIEGRHKIEVVDWSKLQPQLPDSLVLQETTSSGKLATSSGEL
jgi:hypothetical protein